MEGIGVYMVYDTNNRRLVSGYGIGCVHELWLCVCGLVLDEYGLAWLFLHLLFYECYLCFNVYSCTVRLLSLSCFVLSVPEIKCVRCHNNRMGRTP